MFKPQESALAEVRKDGVAGNGRLTAALGALLLALLAAEGATIPFIGQPREEHILMDMLLLGPRVVFTTVALFAIGLALLSLSTAGSWD